MSYRPYAAALLLVISLLGPATTLARQPIRTLATRESTAGAASKSVPAPQQQPSPTPDPNDPIEKIKDEGMKRSQVMATLSYLSDVIGPRLTGSPNMKRANEWTRDQLTKWGLKNAHLESWGPFGRSWELKEFAAQVISPQAIPLIAFPKAWSPGVNIASGEVVYVDAKDEADLTRFKGNLRGKIILTTVMRDVPARFEAPGKRLTEKQLLALADAPPPGADGGANSFLKSPQFAAFMESQIFASKKLKFFTDEGAALLIDSGAGDGGTLFVSAASVPQEIDRTSPMATLRSIFMGSVNPYDQKVPAIVPQIVLSVEHYNRIARMLQAGEKVRMKINFAAQFDDKDLMSYNTIAEIPGTDKSDEIVMLGGHMDSWHAGTGATDNGAGVAVCMEAVRILQALGLKPRRTIRIGLWSGEEQGLFGSRAYVAQHFGKADESQDASFARMVEGGGAAPNVTRGAEYDKLSAYFNLDNGTGKIRGVYLQGNEAVRPLFRQWLTPFRDMGAQTLSISNTGGTDHLAFDAIGLPGFQFIQDQVEYDTRTHHSNQDVFDRIQAEDIKQAATIMAAFVYNTAMRDEKLPRKASK